MVLKISSKFEMRRFCRTTGAVAIVRSLLFELFFLLLEIVVRAVFKSSFG
jgi:hypothetical protein